ncbi:MAG TPA: LysR substrate-binding domain-containing protein [Terriglobia bacterium]|nr:LysR substrate-binding domain-containing protein [Terriglobia bacterium]
MKRQLPPLNALIAAEAAARLGGFKAASEELNVTASAISYQIRSLEAWLGFRLFTRTARSAGLTDAGRRYLLDISALLDDLSLRTKVEMGRSGRGQVLTVQTTDSFASRWLVARLPDFLAKSGGIGVQVVTFEYTESFRSSEADLAILYGDGNWGNTAGQLLLPERIFPVVSPKLDVPGGDPSWPDLLRSLPLLHDDNLGTSWSEWWDFIGADLPSDELMRDLAAGQHFNHSHLTLLAAERGHGITLASSPLVIDALQEKSLVALDERRLETGLGYYVLESGDAATRRRARPFVDWLMARAAADLAVVA